MSCKNRNYYSSRKGIKILPRLVSLKDESKPQILDLHHHKQERICLHNPEFGTTFFKNKTKQTHKTPRYTT